MRKFRPALTQIDHRQHAQLAPIEQRIGDEVHAPYFVDGVRELFGLPALCGLVAPGALQSQRQAFLAVQAIHPLDVVHMALPAQHHVHPAVAIVHARVGDLLDASLQHALVPALGDVQVGRCRHAQDAQRLALAAPEALHEVGHQLASLGGPQNFFATTACSMALSRLRSATICLSLRFSSSS